MPANAGATQNRIRVVRWARPRFAPGVMVTSVPNQPASSRSAGERERRNETAPRRPLARRHPSGWSC